MKMEEKKTMCFGVGEAQEVGEGEERKWRNQYLDYDYMEDFQNHRPPFKMQGRDWDIVKLCIFHLSKVKHYYISQVPHSLDLGKKSKLLFEDRDFLLFHSQIIGNTHVGKRLFNVVKNCSYYYVVRFLEFLIESTETTSEFDWD
jgi:hypothetical protein